MGTNVGQLQKPNRRRATKNTEVRINARMAVGALGLIVCTHSKKIEEFNKNIKEINFKLENTAFFVKHPEIPHSRFS